MAERQINPFLKSALEFGPVLGFFVAYLLLKDESFLIAGRAYEGFIVVTAGRMQIVTAVLIVVFGGLSVWLNDERFFKMKPTLIYLLFGTALLAGLLRGESWLRSVMEGMMPLQHDGWMILTKRVTAFFFGLALLNEIVWRTLSTETWVYFKTFGLPAGVFVFFLLQSGLFKRYALEAEPGAPE